jgi:diguanylate cyclase (GGDEF)-like protein
MTKVSVTEVPPGMSMIQVPAGEDLGRRRNHVRVLIAEDHPEVRDLMEKLLNAWGHDTSVASDGYAALRAIARERWDLVLTDYKMPGANGVQVIRALKHADPQADCIMLTGWSSVYNAVEAMRAGALDYLPKPIDTDRLWDLIQRVEDRRAALTRADEVDPGLLVDPLTGVANFRHLHQALDSMLRDRPALAIALVDLDNFRLLNDTLGADRGDAILRLAANAIREAIGESDIVGRLAGDDFMVIMPGADESRALSTMEHVRASVEQIEIEGEGGWAIPLTVSAGIGVTAMDGGSKPELLRAVEQALLQAKRSGGNATRLRGRDALPQISVRSCSALHGLVEAIDTRDRYTRLPSEQATRQAVRVAHAVEATPDEIRELEIAGPLHDLGKIVIPDSILRKPGSLTPDEWEHMRSHTTMGAIIASSLPDLDSLVDIVRHHHERFDGSGYPAGIRGDQTPRIVRIFSLGDAFSAMVTDRPYRRALSLEVALDEIERGRGSQFHPELVDAFLTLHWDEHDLALAC